MFFRNIEIVERQPNSPNERWSSGASSFTRTFILKDASWPGRVQAAYDILGYNLIASNNGEYYIQRIVPMPFSSINVAVLKVAPDEPPINALIPNFTYRFWAVAIKKTEQLGVSTGLSPQSIVPGFPAPFASGYDNADLSVEFSIFPYQIVTDQQLLSLGGISPAGNPDEGAALANNGWIASRFISRQKDPFSRLIKLPNGYAYAGGVLAKQAVPIREGGNVIRYIWSKVPLEGPTPGYNQERIATATGRINNNWFDGMEPLTVLLDNYYTREYQGTFGEWLADVYFTMIHLPHPATGFEPYNPPGITTTPGGQPILINQGGQSMGWNSIIDVKFSAPPGSLVADRHPVYLPISTDKLGNDPVFRSADFSALFRP